jgi:hypothetical protein
MLLLNKSVSGRYLLLVEIDETTNTFLNTISK